MTNKHQSLRMGYADTASGQIHYRLLGQGPVLVLLHWAPASGRMYEGVMPEFAAKGFKVLAVDLPGYGRSHKASFGWPIDRVAANVFEALDVLGCDRFTLLGGHLSASVAIEMSLMRPNKVSKLVLDGVLNLREEEWATLLRRFTGCSPMMKAGQEHTAFAFDMAAKTLTEWNPDFVLSDGTLPEVYDLLNDYLEMGFGPMRAFVEPESAPPLPHYAIAPRLTALDVPCLVLSAEKEPLRPAFARTLDLIRGSQGFTFPGLHPLVSCRWAEYAAAVSAFMAA